MTSYVSYLYYHITILNNFFILTISCKFLCSFVFPKVFMSMFLFHAYQNVNLKCRSCKLWKECPKNNEYTCFKCFICLLDIILYKLWNLFSHQYVVNTNLSPLHMIVLISIIIKRQDSSTSHLTSILKKLVIVVKMNGSGPANIQILVGLRAP